MRTISENLKTHFASEVTTLARLWKITRTDTTVLGFTDHDKDIVYSGVTYQSETGFYSTSIQNKDDFSVNNLDLQGVFGSGAIEEDDIRSGLYDYARLDFYAVNYSDLTQGHVQLGRGTLGQVTFDKQQVNVEFRGLSHYLETQIGRLIVPNCDAVLGDSRCSVNLASFTFSSTVTSVTDKQVFIASSLAQANDYFTNGYVTFTSGNNDGYSGEIQNHGSGGNIELILEMPYNIEIGDTLNIVAGCGKNKSVCKSKFNNLDNYRGFPDVPVLDRLTNTVDAGQ